MVNPGRLVVNWRIALRIPADCAINHKMSIAKLENQLRRWVQSKDAPASAVIASETGISLRWVQYYRAGKIRNPALRNLVALWDFANK